MKSLNEYLRSGEGVYGSVAGLFIEGEPTGCFYKKAQLTASTHRLILLNLGGFGTERFSVYDYYDITEVQVDRNLLRFRSGASLRLLWLREGEDRHLMNTIRLKAREARMFFPE
ncbi:hypothetical protein AWM70_15810 [Paenibacillus yonginensis]|uniref:YokE-like PH domain-containing protein n=1 Tax=Paenibacillus yonginensis TaxID=1462996 RepID=A0A1B1N366_9BACL|nr:PH domain-containing protein [Paenibacillus yonginensis]ANS75872.1 hypothetical protein AWM70_15810 [Paenibacillus yonginensis]